MRAFPNEISSDDNDHSISDFWSECSKRNLIGPMQALRPEGKRDLYGLCSTLKNSGTHFNYGIGILLDEDTDQTELIVLLSTVIQYGKRRKWSVLRVMGSC